MEVEPDLSNQFVDKKVTRKKFERQVSDFNLQKDQFRKKGILPLLIDFPVFEFAFLAQDSFLILQESGMLGFPSSNINPVNPKFQVNPALAIKIPYPSFLFAIRVDYSNYDVVPPSLRFINPSTSDEMRQVAASITIRPDQQNLNSLVDDRFKILNQNILLQDIEERLFVCLRGLREYHMHPQHDGDAWGLYRNSRLGCINEILDRLYLYSIHNMSSLNE